MEEVVPMRGGSGEGGMRGARGRDCFKKEESSTSGEARIEINHLRWEERC